jgi:hypothetical protein
MPIFGQATVLLVLLSLFCRPCFADGLTKTVQVHTRDELISAVRLAQPGTQILIPEEVSSSASSNLHGSATCVGKLAAQYGHMGGR